jgi:hypothetical protein
MAAKKTGQKSAVTFATGPTTLVVTSITEPDYDGDSFESPTLALDPRACMPVEPTDLVTPGMIEIEFEADEALVVGTWILLKQTVTITFPPPPSLTNGATKVFANAFIKSYKPGALQTNGRRLSTISVQVAGFPTLTAAT